MSSPGNPNNNERQNDAQEQEIVGAFSGNAPTFLSASTTVDGQYVEVVFEDSDSTALLPSVGAITGFSVEADAVGQTIVIATRKGSSGVSARTVQILLDTPLEAGQAVTVSYTPGNLTDNDPAPNAALAFVDESVTNNTSERIAPVFESATSSVDGETIEVVLTEDDSLPILPSTGITGFTVTQDGDPVTVTSAYRKTDTLDPDYERTIVLELADLITPSTTVEVSYTPPDPNDYAVVTDSADIPNALEAFVEESVTNNSVTRVPPVVSSASTDSGGTTITVTLDKAVTPNTPTGFTVYVNGIVRAATVTHPTSVTYLLTLGSSVVAEDLITLDYETPVSSGDRVKDTTANTNQLADFSDFAVTNSVPDTTAPAFLSASVADLDAIDVVFSENRSLPLQPSDPAGFTVLVNGVPRALSSTERLGGIGINARTIRLHLVHRVWPGDTIELHYSSVTGDLTDDLSNAVASFGPESVDNAAEAITGRFFDPLQWAVSETFSTLPLGEVYENRYGWPSGNILFDQTPPAGEIVLNENQGTGGIAVHHFSVYGETQTSGDSGTVQNEILDNTYEGWRFESLDNQSITHVTVSLKASAALTNGAERLYVNIYDNDAANGRPGNRLVRSSDSVLFSALTTSYQDFKLACPVTLEQDTLYWIIIERTTAPLGGTISAKVYADDSTPYAAYTTDSVWDVVLGKVGAYTLTGRVEGASSLAGQTLVYDILDTPLREAAEFGGAEDEDNYEVIGAGDAHSLVRYLDKVGEDYPKVLTIEIGATGSKSKGYVVEAKTDPDEAWQPLFKMVASTQTREYIRYTFKSSVELYAVRMRYRGDYYAISPEGTLTVAGYDAITDVEAVQVSHYADFRDATDFALADTDGWVSFSEGVSLFDWTLTNAERLWTARTGSTALSLRKAVRLGTTLILSDKHNWYTLGAIGPITLQQSLDADVTITDLHVFRNRVYAGSSEGYLYTSSSGLAYTILNPPVSSEDPTPVALPPIGAVSSYRGKVMVATNATSTEQAALWSWNGQGFTLVRRFTQPSVQALLVVNSLLFVATGGENGYQQGAVYQYSGQEWSLTLQTDADAVEALAFSTATQSLYAGLSGGTIWKLAFTDAGVPQTWSRAHSTDSTHILGLSDDPAGEFLWVQGNMGLEAYIAAQNGFYPIAPPSFTRSGLRGTWTNSTSTDYNKLGVGTSQVETVDSTVNYTNLSSSRPTGVNASYVNVVWEGFVLPETTEAYTFYVNAKEGYRLYVAGSLVIDAWEDHASATETSGEIGLYEGQHTAIRLECYYKTGTPSVVLSWQANSFAKEVIPSTALFMPNSIAQIAYQGSSGYGLGLDGKAYLLDSSDLGQRKRMAYLRLRDEAGNVTPLPGLSDEIYEDVEVVTEEDGSVATASGRILHIRPRDKALQATFLSPATGALYGPDRMLREVGIYEAEPFYAATLTQWNTLGMLAVIGAGVEQGQGLERGMAVELYVRTGDTREQVLAADWGEPFSSSTIGTPGNTNAGIVPIEFNIATLSGKWLQYKAVLVSANRNLTPTLRAVILSYSAANASYFFTKVFDTSEESAIVPAPEFRRGLLTANVMENGGNIVFAYTTSTQEGSTFDFSRYIQIEPNTVFELTAPSTTLRFGILLVSVDSLNLAVVDDFAVQLDAGPADMKFMD